MDIVIQGTGADTFAKNLDLQNIWLKEDAVRINNADDVLARSVTEQASKLGFEVNCVPNGLSISQFGIITLDMDSTLIELFILPAFPSVPGSNLRRSSGTLC